MEGKQRADDVPEIAVNARKYVAYDLFIPVLNGGLHHHRNITHCATYAGLTASVIDRETGEVRPAQIFVAVMGASNYTYAEATWSQRLADWIGAHVRAMTFLGAVPEIVVPDNLKSAVRRAHRYEPQLNRTYQEWGEYYGVAILPARKARPRDKAKAEQGVLLVERWNPGSPAQSSVLLSGRTERGDRAVA